MKPRHIDLRVDKVLTCPNCKCEIELITGHKPGLNDRIYGVVAAAGKLMSISDVLAAMPELSRSTVQTRLSDLYCAGRLLRPKVGYYRAYNKNGE